MNDKRNFPLDEERDPGVMHLFAASEQALEDDAFVDGVMARARKLQRQRAIMLLAAIVAALPVTWVLSAPFNDLATALIGFAGQPIVAVDLKFAAPLVAPLNSFGSVLAIAAVGLYAAYRRLFA